MNPHETVFSCHKCGKAYTSENRSLEEYCECGARRLGVSFGKIPRIPNEIEDYVQRIFEEAEKAFGRSRDDCVYEKAFILLSIAKLLYAQPETKEFSNIHALYDSCKNRLREICQETIQEFKQQGFRIPTSVMPGMAEDEMLGLRPNILKIINKEYEPVRTKLLSLTDMELQDMIKHLEIRLKNKLYEQ